MSLSCPTQVPRHVREREVSILFSHLSVGLIELKGSIWLVSSVTNYQVWQGKNISMAIIIVGKLIKIMDPIVTKLRCIWT